MKKQQIVGASAVLSWIQAQSKQASIIPWWGSLSAPVTSKLLSNVIFGVGWGGEGGIPAQAAAATG